MGSFFYHTHFNDVDLVAVVDCSKDQLVDVANEIQKSFRHLGALFRIRVDVTVFTPSEFASNPLRDMSTLIELYRRGEDLAVPNTLDKRPPVAVGHVRLPCADVAAAAKWLETAGLRPIVQMDELAVLELRGGTHVVVRSTEASPAPGTPAPFDLMVDDIDAAHRDYAEKGLSPSPITRGRIHDSFTVPGPSGWTFTVNSSHASGKPV